MTEAYDKALKAYERAVKREKRATRARLDARQALDEACRLLELPCVKCGKCTALGEIVLIDEQTLVSDYDDVRTRHSYTWVCPHCPTEMYLPDDSWARQYAFEPYKWPHAYVARVVVWERWNGGKGREAVARLRAKVTAERERITAEQLQKQDVAHAREVLRKAVLL